ncbi:AAA family ATPase [Bacteroidales bacterium MB20-C3-3]|nr:AAA family ATPase [Bacteroidales bacterium MB20-C3-3]
MKQIKLRSLELLNFKGGTMSINFSETTTIEGDNGTGKTRVFDAFTWLLFGKNSAGDSVFDIKTLDENNEPIHRLTHEVKGLLDVDGKEVVLCRSYAENWKKPRGKEELVMDGHSTTYFINTITVSQAEYEKFVSDMCLESQFKLLTNPLAFNSLSWEKQRSVLFDMAGGVDPRMVLIGKNSYLDLLERMGDMEDKRYREMLRNKISKCKETLEKINPAIEELNRMMPSELNWASLEQLVQDKKKDVETITASLSSYTEKMNVRNQSIMDRSNKVLELRQQMAEMVAIAKNRTMQSFYEEMDKWTRSKGERDKEAIRAQELKQQQSSLVAMIDEKQKAIEAKTQEWYKVNDVKVIIDKSKFACQYCGTEFTPDKIISIQEKALETFQQEKAIKLEKITKEGKALTAERDALKEKLAAIVLELGGVKLTSELPPKPVQPEFEYTPDDVYANLKQRIEELSAENDEQIDTEEQSMLKKRLEETIAQIQDLNKTLQDKGLITKYKSRIRELEEQEKSINQELSGHEGEEQLLLEYSKLMMEAVESAVSSKFEFVKFKLFNKQINGGETPTCQAMVNGVPFQSLNNAMRINAGLDIIRALQNHIGIAAPIFIDNRESVVKITPMNCQIINLVVNKEFKTLNIS